MEILRDTWLTVTAYCDRMLSLNVHQSKISSFLKAGLVSMAFEECSYSYVMAQFGLLTGVENHQLNVSAELVKALGKYYDRYAT